MKHVRLLLLLVVWQHVAFAASPIVVDAEAVAAAIARGAIVWDVRAPDAYAKGHLPGAVSIGDAAKVLRNESNEDFIDTERIAAILGGAGIDPQREVLVYGSRGTWNPYFGLYTLQYFGARNARVYHDGIEAWSASGRPLSSEATRVPAITLKLTVDPAIAVSTREVLARLGKPGVQLIDARTPKEFIGEDIRAIRGGHIPGAINIPYEQNWVDPETPAKLARKQVADNAGMSLKPDAELKKLYARLDPEQETIVYCQSGVRASETAAVLRHLGFSKVRVYDSSWLGYGNTLDAPADNLSFLNVGQLTTRISALQARVEQLERDLAEKTAKK